MPLYNFKCKECGQIRARILAPEEVAEAKGECKKCGGQLIRVTGNSVSSSSQETIDNGIMEKAVTRYTDAEDVYKQFRVAEENMRRLDTV